MIQAARRYLGGTHSEGFSMRRFGTPGSSHQRCGAEPASLRGPRSSPGATGSEQLAALHQDPETQNRPGSPSKNTKPGPERHGRGEEKEREAERSERPLTWHLSMRYEHSRIWEARGVHFRIHCSQVASPVASRFLEDLLGLCISTLVQVCIWFFRKGR